MPKSEASKLATLLLHLEMNPEELERYRKNPRIARAEMAHFGLSKETIEVVISGDLCEFAKLFSALRIHAGIGVAWVGSRRRRT
jgi:hypothetical protein